MKIGILNFEWKSMKNLLKGQYLLTFKVGRPHLQNLLRKTLYSLFESDRGLLDLQFSILKFGRLLYKFLE
jgi:hypothetical protein